MEPEIPAQQAYDQFWPKTIEEIRTMEMASLRHLELPLARIKKIMRLDEDVRMIGAEAPVLFAKAAELFILELTMRAWIQTEDNKRRTLQRNDIAMAIAKYDQFDFLIDIVPREEITPKPTTTTTAVNTATTAQNAAGYKPTEVPSQQIKMENSVYYFQNPTTTNTAAPATTVLQPQIIQLQPQQMVSNMMPPSGGIQIVQQIVTPSGEIQQIPIQLTSQQLQLIRAQMIGGGQQQPLVIQTAPIQATSFSAPAPGPNAQGNQ